MSESYRIKPLEWRQLRGTEHEDGEWWTADTVFGSIEVERWCGSWCWRYCFAEYYDEARHGCNSIADGKAEAEEFYLERIMQALDRL